MIDYHEHDPPVDELRTIRRELRLLRKALKRLLLISGLAYGLGDWAGGYKMGGPLTTTAPLRRGWSCPSTAENRGKKP